MTKSDPRYQAYQMLREHEQNNTFLNLELKRLQGEPRDVRFAVALVYGTVQWQIFLDTVIGYYTKGKRIKPAVRTLLRMGAFQILKMDHVPDSAACNTTVALSKAVGLGGVSGFINAILRTIVRNKEMLPLPEEEQEPIDYLSVTTGYPRWLAERFSEQFGYEKAKSLLQFEKNHGVCIRRNTLKISSDEWADVIDADPSQFVNGHFAPDAWYWKGTENIALSQWFCDGKITIQSEPSQCAAYLIDAGKNEKILDLCAAPGGKSCAMAASSGNEASILACDYYEHRTELIKETAKRLGANVRTLVSDATVLRKEWQDGFDKVLVDAPCSGLGLLWDKPDIRHSLVPDDINVLAELQHRILQCAARYVRPGGRLVYSTCTLTHEENEDQVRCFLSEHAEFRLIPITGSAFKALEFENCIRFDPVVSGTNGFFIALFEKQ